MTDQRRPGRSFRERHSGRPTLKLDDLKDIYWTTDKAERELLPLALFKGRATLGGIQGMWNFTQALREAEVESCGDVKFFIAENPDLPHSAGLHLSESDRNGAISGKLWRFTNRLFSTEGGSRIDPATSEYLRHLMNNSRRLIVTTLHQIDRYSPYSRVSWRKPPAKTIGPDVPINPRWPFLQETRSADTEGMDLLTAVDALVPAGLPNQLREDVCQDVVLSILTGEITLDVLKEPGAPWLKDILRRYRVKYGTISLDAPPPWARDGGRTLLETLAAS